ncbi:MAG: hypothetical protein GJU73_11580 [Ferrovum sp.]|jgi:tRNA A-37 threonylcarbamoyl transferase component Bud32|uniref:hypothetical protein n=1 Tax=Ferrovum sp. TaxID=2609467 RepID=UPI0026257B9F|nr:hypothetical protein [Ferrovum sp.]MBW8068066.1 hypothetical protein [Ferrovum sp.]
MTSSIDALFERKRRIENKINQLREKSEAKMVKMLKQHGIETPEQLDAMLQKSIDDHGMVR